jgi:ASC-1-like (ASCH) protein
MERKISIDSRWYDQIKLKRKTVEGRLNKGQFKELKQNDIVYWVTKDQPPLKTIIKRITVYKSFMRYIVNEGLRHTLPSVTRLRDGLEVYYTYYTKEQEQEFGVLAIEVEVQHS